jgi:hypothetical protein
VIECRGFLVSNEEKADPRRPSHIYVSLYQMDDQCHMEDRQISRCPPRLLGLTSGADSAGSPVLGLCKAPRIFHPSRAVKHRGEKNDRLSATAGQLLNQLYAALFVVRNPATPLC